jgi:elongator complex protein 4
LPPPGTKFLPASSVLITSTGIPSLDDILGGGLPLSNFLTLLAPDSHTSYGDLIHKYFIAQGLLSDQRVIVIDPSLDDLPKTCMWMRPTVTVNNVPQSLEDALEDEPEVEQDSSVKIAWRYQNMKEFQTTISSSQ